MGVVCDACLSLVSTGVCEKEKGIGGRERTCVAIAGRTWLWLNALTYLQLVG